MKSQKIKQTAILFTLLIFPSLLYVIISTGKLNIARLPFLGPKQVDHSRVDENGVPDTIYYKIPPFEFYDYKGKLVDESVLNGKHLVIDFVCTSCNEISPRITSQMVAVQERFIGKGDVALLSVLIDSKNETPETVEKYKNGLKVKEDSLWFFLKASDMEIKAFAEGLLLENKSSDTSSYETNMITVLDKNRHIRGRFDGKQYVETKEVIDIVKALKFVDLRERKGKDEKVVKRK